jgi:hypothetical protein
MVAKLAAEAKTFAAVTGVVNGAGTRLVEDLDIL